MNLATHFGLAGKVVVVTGSRANAIAPGLTATSWTADILSDEERTVRRLSLTPLRRIATTHEIAGTAVFLAGPAAGSITGQTVVIDGGVTISDGN